MFPALAARIGNSSSLSAAAYDFESAGIYYNITGNNTVEVTYSDRDNNTYSGSISVPETVTNNGTEYSVTKSENTHSRVVP